MSKRRKVFILALLVAAAALYGGHLARQARERTMLYEALARQPLEAVQAIRKENLQFTMKNNYSDRALVSPNRAAWQSADTTVQVADQQLIQAMDAVIASIGTYRYDWSQVRPVVAPGTGGVTLSFFDGNDVAATVQFTVFKEGLRWTVEEDGGWLVCWYDVDTEALQILMDGLNANNG
ncbi:MAG: hypothetical protein IKU58_02840 [Clostridia bacterium]|nr:hypothetical protein [Clostridia bacterium]